MTYQPNKGEPPRNVLRTLIHPIAKTEVNGSNLFCSCGSRWSFLEHESHEGFLVADSESPVVPFLKTNRGHRFPAQRTATDRTGECAGQHFDVVGKGLQLLYGLKQHS